MANASAESRAPTGATSQPGFAAFLLGFALGGFFDGILLHQILQWHHLLSGLEGRGPDLRFQILADGLFHAFMYVVAAVGLWFLWRARASLAGPGISRVIVAWGLIGFGVWHIVDAIVAHWLLAIHRIRMDSPNPLFWDLLWFFVFGVAFVVVGLWVLRGARRPSGGAGTAAILAFATVATGALALLPPADDVPVVAVFRPGVTHAQVMQAVAAADGRIVWLHESGAVAAIDLSGGGSMRPLYANGAMFVAGGMLAFGCLPWTRA